MLAAAIDNTKTQVNAAIDRASFASCAGIRSSSQLCAAKETFVSDMAAVKTKFMKDVEAAMASGTEEFGDAKETEELCAEITALVDVTAARLCAFMDKLIAFSKST